ncbi:PqqD family peptide modification chaperone [Streptomyces sp. NPDC052179]|uniref:PqqD family peptide modification chaperone n=1 Tax=Streptomyces sp. NPDC052179 TaxID=3155680 RepID=UPI00344014ED
MLLLHEHTHPVLTDEGGAILDERTGRWSYLTPTAASAVLFLLSSTTEDQAAEQYAERYGISRDQAANDIRTVTTALSGQGVTARSAVRRPRWRRVR